VAYVPELEERVKAALLDLSPRSAAHLDMKACQWKVGTTVEISLRARRLVVEPASQTFVWDGTKVLVEFDVTVPDDCTPGAVVLKFDASVDGIVVAALRTDLEIAVPGAAVSTTSSHVVSASARAFRTAFASYSSVDRQRVLDRVASASVAARLDVFLDCLSLHPGEEWRPRLEEEIGRRDTFMLFWSQAAAESEEVSWEWRTALRKRGKKVFQIHPLESGLRPPPELEDHHFGDRYMLARRATEPPA